MRKILKNRIIQLALVLIALSPLMGFTVWESHCYVPTLNYKYGASTEGELWAYPPVNGYLCCQFPWHNPPVYDFCDYFGDPRHEFGYGVRVTPYICEKPLDESQVFMAVTLFKPPLKKYNIKWTVKGGTVIREWGEHNEYIRIKLENPKLEIVAEIPPTNMRDIYYLKYHHP